MTTDNVTADGDEIYFSRLICRPVPSYLLNSQLDPRVKWNFTVFSTFAFYTFLYETAQIWP